MGSAPLRASIWEKRHMQKGSLPTQDIFVAISFAPGSVEPRHQATLRSEDPEPLGKTREDCKEPMVCSQVNNGENRYCSTLPRDGQASEAVIPAVQRIRLPREPD